MTSILTKPNSEANLPPLDSGDQLTRPEFERRYDAMPDSKKAELIDGVVFMASPARYKQHGQQHNRLNGIFFCYVAATPGTDAADNCSLRLDMDNATT